MDSFLGTAGLVLGPDGTAPEGFRRDPQFGIISSCARHAQGTLARLWHTVQLLYFCMGRAWEVLCCSRPPNHAHVLLLWQHKERVWTGGGPQGHAQACGTLFFPTDKATPVSTTPFSFFLPTENIMPSSTTLATWALSAVLGFPTAKEMPSVLERRGGELVEKEGGREGQECKQTEGESEKRSCRSTQRALEGGFVSVFLFWKRARPAGALCRRQQSASETGCGPVCAQTGDATMEPFGPSVPVCPLLCPLRLSHIFTFTPSGSPSCRSFGLAEGVFALRAAPFLPQICRSGNANHKSSREKYFDWVRMGQLSLCSPVLLLPLASLPCRRPHHPVSAEHSAKPPLLFPKQQNA